VDARPDSGLRGEAHSLSSSLLGGRSGRREDSVAGSSSQGRGRPDVGGPDVREVGRDLPSVGDIPQARC
jgi:hypothetical protein